MDGRPFIKGSHSCRSDGLIIEVHNDPANALCDGQQSIKPEEYGKLLEDLRAIAKAVGREL